MRLILNCFVLCFFTIVNCQERWLGDASEALKAAQSENRPIVAVFLSSGCPWSIKLSEEVLDNPLFIEKMSGEAILWKTSDKSLLNKYKVKVCPMVLLLDPKGKEFARTDYAPLDYAGYAALMIERIDSFQEICIALESRAVLDEEKWQELYHKAKKLSADCYGQVILERGLRLEKGSFFHLEKYSVLLGKHKWKHPQVVKAKKKLLERDPRNERGTHYQVACLEFQKMASRSKSKERPEKALIPLFRYLEKFGKKDPENYWKCELLIAEYFYSYRSMAPALEHAHAAYASAPDFAKQQIAETIALMQGEK